MNDDPDPTRRPSRTTRRSRADSRAGFARRHASHAASRGCRHRRADRPGLSRPPNSPRSSAEPDPERSAIAGSDRTRIVRRTSRRCRQRTRPTPQPNRPHPSPRSRKSKAAASGADGPGDAPARPTRSRPDRGRRTAADSEQEVVRRQGAERPRGVDQGGHRAEGQDRGARRVLRPDRHPGRGGHRQEDR